MNHSENLNKNKIKFIGLVTLLMGFAQAMLAYIMSSYLKISSGTENLGVFYFVAYGVSIIIFFNLHKVVSRIGKSRAPIFSILAKVPILLLLSVLPTSYYGILFIILYIIAGNISWVCLDMVLETCSMDHLSGRIRGLHLTIMNIGILLGPFFSTRFLDQFGFPGVFSVMIFLYTIIIAVALVKLRDFNCDSPRMLSVRQLLAKITKRKNVLRAYYISFVLEFFYAIMLVFMPLYLRDLGVSWSQIGIIFTFMLVPFVLFQLPVGYLADKRTGEKELIILSLIMTGIAAVAIYFVQSFSVFIWSLVMFSTRVGVALLEVLRDSYFYKRIGSRDIDLIDFFRTAQSTAYIVASVISTLFLFFFPLKSIFLLLAVVVFSALIPASRLVDNKSESEISAENSK